LSPFPRLSSCPLSGGSSLSSRAAGGSDARAPPRRHRRCGVGGAIQIVDMDPYDPDSMAFDDRNLALPIGFNFPSSQKVAALFEAKFLEKTALE